MKRILFYFGVVVPGITFLSFIQPEPGNEFKVSCTIPEYISTNGTGNSPISNDYLLPIFEPSEDLLKACAKRRVELIEKMEGDIAIFGSAENLGRKVGNFYEYRQSSNFYYLTGFMESNAVLILMPDTENPFVMFVNPYLPWRAASTGDLFGIDGAKDIFGADQAYSFFEIRKILPEILKGKGKICMESGDEVTRKLVDDVLEGMGLKNKPEIIDIAPVVHEMRVIKDEVELKMLRKAIDITARSHREAMKATRPGLYEYEVEAIIEYNYRKSGAYRPGFASIVGSGRNSTILHYRDSEKEMMDGEMLLMDLGAEYNMYTADITRTIPVNGKFTKEQRELYEIVLNAQKAAIDLMKPGKGITESYNAALKVFAKGLFDLGLMTDINSDWQVRFYTIHGISHYIGLSVHDVGDYGRRTEKGRILEPGMILTIEPGIYMREDRLEYLHEYLGKSVPEEEIIAFLSKVGPVYEKYKNIGIRIEDDILITENGNEIVSAKAPREVEDIEKLMNEESLFIDG